LIGYHIYIGPNVWAIFFWGSSDTNHDNLLYNTTYTAHAVSSNESAEPEGFKFMQRKEMRLSKVRAASCELQVASCELRVYC
jgi:hypothetical protein